MYTQFILHGQKNIKLVCGALCNVLAYTAYTGVRAKVMEMTLLYWKGLRIGLKERHSKPCLASPFLHSFFLSTCILLIPHPYSHCETYTRSSASQSPCRRQVDIVEWFQHMTWPNHTTHGYILRNIFFSCRQTFPSIFEKSHIMNP